MPAPRRRSPRPDRGARPAPQVIQWDDFSLRIANVSMLPQVLSRVSDEQLLRMRRAMQRAWPRLLYSRGPFGSFLGESDDADVVATLLQVLKRRLVLEEQEGEPRAARPTAPNSVERSRTSGSGILHEC